MPSYPTGQQKADEWKVTAMAAKRDYYEILGIDKNADDNTIKKAYRKLAKNTILTKMPAMPRQRGSLRR